MRVFLYCSGSAKRWARCGEGALVEANGTYKQLLSDGEQPVLLRTVKQLLSRECIPVIVTPHQPIKDCIFNNLPNDCISHHVDFLDVGSPPLLVETILATRDWWTAGEVTIGLMGDVFFSEAAMDTIISQARQARGTMWFGRAQPSRITGNMAAELFGWSHKDPEDMSAILRGLQLALDDANSKPEERDMIGTPLGGLWQFRRGTLGMPLMQEPDPSVAWCCINDFTDDWDTPEQHQRWLSNYRKRIIRQPKFTRITPNAA